MRKLKLKIDHLIRSWSYEKGDFVSVKVHSMYSWRGILFALTDDTDNPDRFILCEYYTGSAVHADGFSYKNVCLCRAKDRLKEKGLEKTLEAMATMMIERH